MKDLISKELLGEIVKEDILDIKIERNIVKYDSDFDDVIMMRGINIYELAHEGIEWAYDKYGYELVVSRDTVGIWKNGEEIHLIYNNEDNDINDVFKACQWVYDKENK